MAKQTGEAILAELKELNSRVGRIEQLLQPMEKINPQLTVSSTITPDQLQTAIFNALADSRNNSQLSSL